MGPHFFKCGKECVVFCVKSTTALLQWGRTFSSAESACRPLQLRIISSASMGPHFFKCGKTNRKASLLAVIGASMGPHFFKCGKFQFSHNCQWEYGSASMGPHFFKCGKQSLLAAKRANRFGFNGAALFQVRKTIFTRSQTRKPVWLQWGRTFSSAEKSSLGFQAQDIRIKLQWGRTFSSAEKVNARMA